LQPVADAPFTRAERRASTRRRRIRRRLTVAVLLLLTGAAAGAVWAADPDVDADSDSAQPVLTRSSAPRERRKSAKPTRPLRLASRAAGLLAAPVQDAAIATVGRRILLLGGLDAADMSTADVRVVVDGRTRTIARLPRAFHDATAVALGASVYIFGGGDGIRQLDQIVRVDPQTGAARSAGALPVPSSDSAAAALGGTAYVVGGYTGTSWLSTIVAWRPGRAPRVVAHLPSPLRYAAVAAGNGRVVIAGGSLPSGAASRAVYSFDPRAASVRRIGVLPAPTTHAAAASLGKRVLVIGGRSARPGTPHDEIVSIEPLTGRIAAAGKLARAVSDAAVTTLGRVLVVAGGRGRATTAQVTRLVPVARARRATHPARVARALGVYAYDGANALSAVVQNMPPRIYVPNSASNTVDVIDQRTFKIVAHYAVGRLPQHVTPSYDLKTLYVDNDEGNSLTPVSPFTGRPKGPPIPVSDPYNLYFTPSGRYAIVVAERNQRLDFRYAHTMRVHRSLRTPCRGVDHVDFSADGHYLIASCEFSGQMLRVDVRRERVTGVLTLPRHGAMPQDVKLSPDGRIFYVADMASNGVWEINGNTMRVIRFIHTGAGAHGLYPSRDSKLLYITNRNEGTISVLDFATRRLVAKWDVGGSPDMGGVSADGNVLWLSGRYDAQVYAISTKDGRVLARIPVGYGPHGLCVWPQPGRYSLGHTGILR
jgi:DNA-binding beta-propeller fold protein YncE